MLYLVVKFKVNFKRTISIFTDGYNEKGEPGMLGSNYSSNNIYSRWSIFNCPSVKTSGHKT